MKIQLVLSNFLLALYTTLLIVAIPANAEKNTQETQLTVAILPFHARGIGDEMGNDLQVLLTAQLSGNPNYLLVERADIDKAISELELSLSGNIDPNTAAKIGQIVGAQIIVTGRIFPVQNEVAMVAKIIGTETSRVLGASAGMPSRGSLIQASASLASEIDTRLSAQGGSLVAKPIPQEDLVAKLKPLLEGKVLPTISVRIPEVSMDKDVLDPAAETEISLILQQLGFELRDPIATNEAAAIYVDGSAFSEFAMRKGNLVSAKGRVEIKAYDRKSGKIIFVDRQTSVAVELSPEIAGKLALERGGRMLAERFVTALIKSL